MTIPQLYEIYLRHPSIRTDTRQLKPGDLFFALKGPNFNGNQFAARALEQGAAYAIIDEAPTQTSGPSASSGPSSPASPAPASAGNPSPSGNSASPVQASASSASLPQASSGAASISGSLSDRLILVPDVLTALQDLALHHRRQFNIPFIAITGSNGKTTTKELVHAVLSSTYITYTTQGNLNNHIGIPITVLSVRPDAQLAVIEMGANHQKEIEGYCRYALPTHGIITNVGKAHLEGFGGPEGVRKGKGELFDFLRSDQVPAVTSSAAPSSHGTSAPSAPAPASSGGTAFVMWDYDYLREMSHDIPHIIKYGTHDADITGTLLPPGRWASYPPSEPGQPSTPDQARPSLPSNSGPSANSASPDPGPPPVLSPDAVLTVTITQGAAIPILSTQLVGDYNLPNVLAAVAVGKYFGVPDKKIKTAIEEYTPFNSRSQRIEWEGNHVVLDAYNANPSSMRAAIENFAAKGNAPGQGNHGHTSPFNGSKILILGAMAELGPESLAEHRAIVDLIRKYHWEEVVLVGGDFLQIPHGYLSFPDSRAAAQWLRNAGLKNAYILIKGSRSMKMEEVIK
jgi:UDP-N-acetylmuramoyl-tripeptide--D-alanyl-D-alanine ligase